MLVVVWPGPPAIQYRAKAKFPNVGRRNVFNFSLRYLPDFLIQCQRCQEFLGLLLGFPDTSFAHRTIFLYFRPFKEKLALTIVCARKVAPR